MNGAQLLVTIWNVLVSFMPPKLEHVFDSLLDRVEAQIPMSLAIMQQFRTKVEKASAEKICFTRFKIHGLAVFLPNANGHFEAINHKCPNYYLSEESIALAVPRAGPAVWDALCCGSDCAPGPEGGDSCAPFPPSGVIAEGSPEHGSSGTPVSGGGRDPYGLPLGTEYYVATTAMVPDL